MNLCSDKHDEVAYECRRCPVCELMKEHKEEVDSFEDSNMELRTKVTLLEEHRELLDEIVGNLKLDAEELRSQIKDLESMISQIPST